MTEADLYALLRRRFAQDGGNGPANVLVPSVRSDAGFAARRTIDAVALGLWPSRGMFLTGFEIKCARSDWLRELKNPAKAEEFAARLDFLTLVVADEKIVQPGELPDSWGLLVAQGGRLVQKVEAKALRDLTPDERRSRPLPEGFTRGFLVALMRQAARQGDATPEAIRAAVDAAVVVEREHAAHGVQGWRERAERVEETIRTFQRESGVSLSGHRFGYGHPPEKVAQALRLVLDGDDQAAKIQQRLQRLASTADGIRQEIDAHIAALEPEGVAR